MKNITREEYWMMRVERWRWDNPDREHPFTSKEKLRQEIEEHLQEEDIEYLPPGDCINPIDWSNA